MQHNYSFPGYIDSKATGRCIYGTINRLEGDRAFIFNNTAFGYWRNVPKIDGDPALVHGIMLKEVRPDAKLLSQQKMRFRIGKHELTFGPEEFCLITGFMFGFRPNDEKHIVIKESTFRQRVFPEINDSDLKISDLQTLVKSPRFVEIDDHDAVRVCLLIILRQGFMGKGQCDKVTIPWLSLVEDLKDWDRYVALTFIV